MHRVLHPVPPGGYISSRFSNLWEVETKRRGLCSCGSGAPPPASFRTTKTFWNTCADIDARAVSLTPTSAASIAVAALLGKPGN